MASEHLQRGDPTVSGQPVPVIQHRTAQPGAQKEPLCSDLCSLLLVLALGAAEKSQAPSSLHFPFRYL